ncbi:MAG TPA: flagellar basal body rod protein FlgB [Candidatus Desulfobacillus sp.]|nr:flagellar basal body rod protein FlgB [Candidatus Desulfobacillus sp.]
MIDRINNELGFHQQALNLRAYRQQVLASNIANADTPHYKARDVDFKASLQGALGGTLGLLRTDARHLAAVGDAAAGARLRYRSETQSSVDGNTVDMDVERAAFAENAIGYEASLTFINQMLRNIQSALQPQ